MDTGKDDFFKKIPADENWIYRAWKDGILHGAADDEKSS